MITVNELTALIEILNRAPMSTAERLWVVDLLNRLVIVAKEQKEDGNETCAPPDEYPS